MTKNNAWIIFAFCLGRCAPDCDNEDEVIEDDLICESYCI